MALDFLPAGVIDPVAPVVALQPRHGFRRRGGRRSRCDPMTDADREPVPASKWRRLCARVTEQRVMAIEASSVAGDRLRSAVAGHLRRQTGCGACGLPASGGGRRRWPSLVGGLAPGLGLGSDRVELLDRGLARRVRGRGNRIGIFDVLLDALAVGLVFATERAHAQRVRRAAHRLRRSPDPGRIRLDQVFFSIAGAAGVASGAGCCAYTGGAPTAIATSEAVRKRRQIMVEPRWR